MNQPLNRLRNTTVYVAGPVEAVSDGGADWRDAITGPLHQMGIKVWNPLIKPNWVPKYDASDQYKDKEEIIDAMNNGIFPIDAHKRLDNLRNNCLRLADACDFIICKLGGKTVGTFEEISIKGGKPVLFIGEFDSTWRYVQFFQQDKFFFKDINDIVGYLIKVDNGAQQVDPLTWIFLDNNWPG